MNAAYHPCKNAMRELRQIRMDGYLKTAEPKVWNGPFDYDGLTVNYLDVINAVFYQAWVDLVNAFRRYRYSQIVLCERFFREVMPEYLNVDPEVLINYALAFARHGKKHFAEPHYSGYFYGTELGIVDHTSPDDSAFKYLLYTDDDEPEMEEDLYTF